MSKEILERIKKHLHWLVDYYSIRHTCNMSLDDRIKQQEYWNIEEEIKEVEKQIKLLEV